MPVGKGVLRRQGRQTAILAFGSMVQPALAAAEELNATVADMRFVKPLDETLIVKNWPPNTIIWSPVEENAVQGGAGSAVCWKCWRSTKSAARAGVGRAQIRSPNTATPSG